MPRHDAADSLRVVHCARGHDFPPDVREQASTRIDAAFAGVPPPSSSP
jgi:hypothetical protein